MSDVLFLAHRIPYPPNKGDKIRSWRWLETVARHHTVHLGAFIDDPADWKHTDHLRALCGSCHFEAVKPIPARIRALTSAARGRSLTEGFYANSGMRRWVRQTFAERAIQVAFGFSSGVAPYLMELAPQGVRRVLDLCDVDSDKWRQFAATTAWPMRYVHAFEHRRLAAAEREWVRACDAVLVISGGERELLERVVGSCHNAFVVGNGVDHGYFDPSIDHPNPYAPDALPIVFTGAMDYWANVEAAEWFARTVLPIVRAQVPNALFAIVGSNPHARVTALAQRPGVLVTGSVPDTRPYIQHARCVAVPLRIARGVQNKVLEAMAMARPIIATPEAVAGLAAHGPIAAIDVASSPVDFATAVIRQLHEARQANHPARQFVLERFDWGSAISAFMSHLMPAGAGR